MEMMRLGRTGIQVCRSGFGALPIQRVSLKEAVSLLRKAYNHGINFFDTARYYSDSEEKIGAALSPVRKSIIIATKSMATTRAGLIAHLETSLKNLHSDYVDIMQLHNPSALPDPADPDSSYGGLREAQKRGMARYIGISNHRLPVALDAVRSGLYDTVQFPLSFVSSESDFKLAEECRTMDCGLIAMKALAGGLITTMAASFAYLRKYDNILPIWGIQRDNELNEMVALEKNPPVLDGEMMEIIRKDRQELAGLFCRGCGYCMPCPAGIEINWAARMSLLLRRAPYQGFLTDAWRDKMALIHSCTHCGQCQSRCPYGIDTPSLLKRNLDDYENFYAAYKQ
jgi:aryl-alcohol dehydrogenase-like predicted oxidoreductase